MKSENLESDHRAKKSEGCAHVVCYCPYFKTDCFLRQCICKISQTILMHDNNIITPIHVFTEIPIPNVMSS